MQIFREIKPLMAFLREKKRAGYSIGFVPTMGALHAGHASLIEAAQKNECFTVCSIFVNPTQFNNAGDLEKYPRTLEADADLLERQKCDVLFVPDAKEMYPEKSATTFDFGGLDKTMEGEFRPGHFSGVALVVSKLFHVVMPDHAFFGQKDWQQFTIVKRLVRDLNFDLTLHAVPTLREPDGLAMSSRNLRLSSSQRTKATVFHQALLQAKDSLTKGIAMGEVRQSARALIERDPDVRLEYIQLANRENLIEKNNVQEPNQSVLCIAGFVGDIRLIDNILL